MVTLVTLSLREEASRLRKQHSNQGTKEASSVVSANVAVKELVYSLSMRIHT
jgi:hypothetical protein